MSIIRTHSGRDIDLLAPSSAQIDIRDIAVALSRIARFNGATNLPYSVAQHSVLVACITAKYDPSPSARLAALLHDAHEAYLGDITRPAFAALGAAAHAVEDLRTRLDRAIGEAFGIDLLRAPSVVAMADHMALAAEWRDLMPGPAPFTLAAIGWPVKPKRADVAEQAFLREYDHLALLLGATARISRSADQERPMQRGKT